LYSTGWGIQTDVAIQYCSKSAIVWNLN
jgi:hypothetical protein